MYFLSLPLVPTLLRLLIRVNNILLLLQFEQTIPSRIPLLQPKISKHLTLKFMHLLCFIMLHVFLSLSLSSQFQTPSNWDLKFVSIFLLFIIIPIPSSDKQNGMKKKGNNYNKKNTNQILHRYWMILVLYTGPIIRYVSRVAGSLCE